MERRHAPAAGLPAIANILAEKAVVGALLTEPSLIDVAIEKLTEADFAHPLFGRLFAALVAEHASGRRPTPISIGSRFRADADLDALGGPAFLVGLMSAAAALYGPSGIEQVAELARQRRLATELSTALDALRSGSADVPDVLEQIEAATSAVHGDDAARPAMTIADALMGVVDRSWGIREGRIKHALLLPGFSDWNDVTGGMRAGDLILVGARPGMAKTTLALSVSRRAALAGMGVLFVSREMKTEQLALRVAADMLLELGSPVTFDQVKTGNLTNEEIRALERVVEEANALPIIVEQPASLPVMRLGAMVRRQARRMTARGWKLGLIVVDYLGLLEPPAGKGNREQEVSAISRQLKAIAAAADVPLIALTQLSRAVEQREDKRPQLSDLRDSGSLEQDADCVVFLYREAYYLQNARPSPDDHAKMDEWHARMGVIKDRLEIYSAKVRQGEPTRRDAYFFGHRQAIRNSDYYQSGGGWPA